MEALKTALFEDPLWIYVALGAVEAILLLRWRARGTGRIDRALLVAPILAGLVFITAALVVTDPEQIRAACDEITRAVNRREPASIARYLDTEFGGAFHTPDSALRQLDNNIERHNVTNVRFKIMDLDFMEDRAFTKLRTRVMAALGSASLDWRISWIKRPDGWRIIHVDRPRFVRSLVD